MLRMENLFLCCLFTLFAGIIIHWYFTKTFNRWKHCGVIYEKPLIIFGNIKDRILFKKSFHEFQILMYNKFRGHKVAGFFEGRRPTLIILDPEILKCILIRDFDHFMDRPTLRFRTSAYTQNMILSLKGQHWKAVRTQMTPAFSSGKLKSMEPLVRICAKQMEDFVDKTVILNDNNSSAEFDVKDFFGRFTMDVIASCAFGVQCDSLKNPNAEFIRITSQFNDLSIFKRTSIFIILLLAPQLSRFIPLSFFNLKSVNFLSKVVISAKHHRIKNPQSRRNDFLQLMLDAEINEKENRENKLKENGAASQHQNTTKFNTFDIEGCESGIMTEETVVAQSILFLIAGYETSSTLLTFASYELAINQDIQDKLRSEILAILEKYNGECNYQALSEMHYLEMVLSEALRKHPPVSRIDRVCTKPYSVPGTDVLLNKGDTISVPIIGFHYDPNYYPDPEKFDPERFSNDNKNVKSPYVYLPFGAGPRNCIGLRFAMLSTKSAMVHLLKKYKLTVCPKTEYPYKYSRFSMLLKPEKDIWLNIEKL